MNPKPIRERMPITLERMALASRYIVYALLAPLYFVGALPGTGLDLLVFTLMTLFHCVFSHYVFWMRRYEWFFSRFNFFLYFSQVCLAVLLTGPARTDAYLLYFLFILGSSVYDRRFARVMLVSALCAVSYAAILLADSLWHRAALPLGPLLLRTLGIIFAGWLIAALTERLRRTEELSTAQASRAAASEATLRTILDAVGDPIVVFDDHGRVAEANARAADFFGISREQLIGEPYQRFFFDDGTLEQRYDHMRRRGEAQHEEIVVLPDGEERTVQFVARSFRRDETAYAVAVLRDVTEQKDLQEATRQANQQLEKLNADLQQLDRLKTGLLRSMSLNLRSPLSAIAGYVEMLLEEELGEINIEQRRALQTCRRCLTRLFRLIEQSLDTPPERAAMAPLETSSATKDEPETL